MSYLLVLLTHSACSSCLYRLDLILQAWAKIRSASYFKWHLFLMLAQLFLFLPIPLNNANAKLLPNVKPWSPVCMSDLQVIISIQYTNCFYITFFTTWKPKAAFQRPAKVLHRPTGLLYGYKYTELQREANTWYLKIQDISFFKIGKKNHCSEWLQGY